MRVAHCIWSLEIGGAENMLVDIVNQQAKACEVFLFVGNNQYDKRLLARVDARVKVVFGNRQPGSRNPLTLFRVYKRLAELKADVYHAHVPSLIRILKHIAGVKVLTVHNTNPELPPDSDRYDAIICISEAVRSDVAARFPALRTYVIDNGIDFGRVVARTAPWGRRLSIVQVGRLDAELKGQDVLIKALPLVLSQIERQHVTVTFVGNGPSAASLKELADSCQVGDVCRFAGGWDRDEIYARLHEFDLLVQPSRYEGFGLTVVEAIAAMIPVLASEAEGPLEILEAGKWGYHCRPGSHEDLAEKVIGVYREWLSQDFIEKRNAAAQYLASKYDISVTARRYLSKYEELVRAGSRREITQ